MSGSLNNLKNSNPLKNQSSRPNSQSSLDTTSLNLSLSELSGGDFGDLDNIFDNALQFIKNEHDHFLTPKNENQGFNCDDEQLSVTIPDELCEPNENGANNFAEYFEKLRKIGNMNNTKQEGLDICITLKICDILYMKKCNRLCMYFNVHLYFVFTYIY